MCPDPGSLLARHFNTENLERVFCEKIQFQSATGTDGVSARKFGDILLQEVPVILRKVHAGSYSFSRYREKLIVKSREKPPRVIAIPTVRDKLVLRVLNECLSEVYAGCHPPPINRTIADLKAAFASGRFTGYLRLDIKDFYPTIQHAALLARIGDLRLPREIEVLVERSIKQRTFSGGAAETVGIPQGLPISNAVANLYLATLDQRFSDDAALHYRRFVDDILILGPLERLSDLHGEIEEMLGNLGLSAHPLRTAENDAVSLGKTVLAPISEPVSYLGYRLAPRKTSVRPVSLHKLKESIIAIFVRHARQKKRGYRKKLLWRLNLRITGCVVNQQRFGWLFFFSEIDDLSLLKALDVFVGRQLERWQLRGMKPRKFVRTFFEIRYRAETTAYVPSFDGYALPEKVTLLKSIFGVKIDSSWSERDISREFYARLRRETLALEEDLVRLS